MNEMTADHITKLKERSEECTWHHSVSAVTPIILIYLVLAFYRLDSQSFWTDEAFSVNQRFLAGPMWTDLNRISPLYFLLLGLWSEIVGTSEFALRALSTLLGVVAVCITYGIAYRLFSRRTAVFASILLATSPYLIWYAQEVRYITLTITTSLMMTYSFHRVISGGSWRWWLAYGASSLLALFSLVTVVLLIGAHGLYVLSRPVYRPVWRRWMIFQGLILLVFVTWFTIRSGPNLIRSLTTTPTVTSEQQLTRSAEIMPASDVAGSIPYTFYAFSVGFSFGPSVRELHVSRSISTIVSHAPQLVAVGVLFATIFVLGLKDLRQNLDAGFFLLLWLAIPIVGAFMVASTTTFHQYNTRYVAMCLPAYMLILSIGITGIRHSGTQLTLLGLVLIMNGIALANYYFDTRYAREDARAAAEYLESVADPLDHVWVIGNPAALQYYYKEDPPLVVIRRQTAKDSSLVVAKLQELPKHYNRLWVVEIRPWQSDPKGNVRATLEELAHRDQLQSFPGVDIHTYSLADYH